MTTTMPCSARTATEASSSSTRPPAPCSTTSPSPPVDRPGRSCRSPGTTRTRAHPAARGRPRAPIRSRADATVPGEPRADRLAARHQRLQPRLPLLLRAQVPRRHGRGHGRRVRRRPGPISRRHTGSRRSASSTRAARPASTPRCCSRCTTMPRPLRRGRSRAVRRAAQQRGCHLRPARARARRTGDRGDGVAGRDRRGSRRPTADRGRPAVFQHGRTVDRPVAGRRHRPAPVDHHHRPERRPRSPPVVRFALERELTFSFNFFRDNACSAGSPTSSSRSRP